MMLPALPNRLHSRRGFLDKLVTDAKVAGVGGTLAALGLRPARARSGDTNPWAYDVSRYLVTDAALIGYTEKASFASPRKGARGLTLDADGHLWLTAGRTVLELSAQGALLSEFSTTQEVRALAVGGDMMYAAFKDQVAVISRNGEQRALWEAPGGKPYFTGIAAGGTAVFVADAGNRVVHRYDPSGQAINRIGDRNKERNIPGFIVPSPFFSVAWGKDGLLRTTNPGRHRVELYTPEGDLEMAWGEAGAAIQSFCGCCNPIDLALLPDGRTVTFEKGIPRVKVYSATGQFECVVAGPESFAENAKVCGPNDCTLGGMDGVVDTTGRVLILDFVTGTVRVMERKP
jgi:hypothetical protein